MAELAELIKAIADLASNQSSLLIVAGLIFLAIGAWGKIEGKINLGRPGRIISGLIGFTLLICGLLLPQLGLNRTDINSSSSHATLQKSYDLASRGDFAGAIQLAETIPANSDKYSQAKQKIVECQQGGKSDQEKLQKSYDLASRGDFAGAIQLAETIPANSDKYSQAKQKIVE
ncbi:MAG: hypothetical protein EWV85_22855, partial [Microcystis aeruginosa Ma_QC_C_20070703_M131]